MIAPRASLLLLLLLAACRGCKSERDEPTMTLPEAADKAIFATVETLGPHRCLAKVTRKDTRAGVVVTTREEAVEIAWKDWDRFRYTRLSDGEPASEVIVAGGRAFARSRGGRWDEREDAEPYRVQLQSTWDTWDEAMEPFGDRVALKEVARELIEGRWARKFAVSLAPAPQGRPRGRAPAFTPTSLSGAVWVDEVSAVRLLAEVEGTLVQGNLERAITLRLARSDFGLDLGIRAPERGRGKRAAAKATP